MLVSIWLACSTTTPEAPPVPEVPAAANPELERVDVPRPEAAPDGELPTMVQGRWGRAPADCEPDRPAAEGLLTIDADSLAFYESRGTVTSVEVRGERGLRAEVAYAGEGEEWTRIEKLKVSADGKTLTRRTDDAQHNGPWTYTRCE